MYLTDWPLTPTRNIILYLEPNNTVPYDSLQEALAAPELQVHPSPSFTRIQCARLLGLLAG